MDEIKAKREEIDATVASARAQIANANKALELMEKEMQGLQQELNNAKLEIVRGDGAPEPPKGEEEAASQEAVSRLTPEEKKGLHDGLFTAISQAMQLQECQQP